MSVNGLNLESWHGNDMLCRVVLGLTCYFERAPTRDDVVRAYSVYRAICPPDRRSLVTSVRQKFYRPMDRDDIGHVYRALEEQDRRLDEGIVVWDGHDAQQWMFWMQGVVGKTPDERAASFCQIFMPEDTAYRDLIGLAQGLCENVPLLSGHAGFTVQFSGRFKDTAFDQIYIWAKRFIGLEVEDLNSTLPFVIDAIKGANWLTMIDHQLWNALVKPGGSPQRLPMTVTVENYRYARLLKAGPQPILGDRNRGEFPDLYAAVERFIAPTKVSKHAEFPGKFAERNETDMWLHRLMKPDAW